MQRGIFIAAILALAGVLFGPYGCPASERGASPAKAPPIPPITPETVTSAAETIQILRGSSLAMLPGGSEPPTWENQYGRDYVPILDLAEGDGGDIFACTGTHGLVHLTSEAGGALRPVAAHFPGELETTKPGFGRCERVTAHGTDVFAAHRGDWFVPQSHIAHRRMQNGRLEDVALLRLEASVEDIAVSGRTLFAALHEEGIQRFTITGAGLASGPVTRGFTNAWALALAGDTLLVADGAGGLARVPMSGSGSAEVKERIVLPGTALDVAVSSDGGRAYVALGAAGVAEVALGESLSLTRRIAIEGSAVQVGIRGETLIVSAWSNGQTLASPAGSPPKRTGIHAINNERGASRTFTALHRETDLLVGDWFGIHRIRFHAGVETPAREPRAEAPPLVLGQPAPEGEGVLPNGEVWRLSDHRGKVVVLAFFGSFCPVCLLEFADLEGALWREPRHPDLRVVGLGVHETPDRVTAFQRQSGASFPLLIARDQLNTGLLNHREPGISQYPFEVVIDRKGRIASMSSRHSPAALLTLLEDLLKAP